MSGQPRILGSRPPGALPSYTQYTASLNLIQGGDQLTRYDSTREKLPYEPWYALEHDKIKSGIREACLDLLKLTSNHSSSDTEVANLNTALQAAEAVSRGKGLYVAILGEQGIGKSSVLCSLFDRYLVDVSSSSSACTTFPTIITYKEGASDDTDQSDVHIEYMNDDEIRDCVEEQGRRYRAAYPRKHRPKLMSRAYDSARIGSFLSTESDEDDEEEEELDEEEKREILNSAKTARDFFNIIFQVRKIQLEDDLEYGDIESGRFSARCVQYAKQHLTSIGVSNGFTHHTATFDEDLSEVRQRAEEVWPLVKSVRIATGHRLLRNNLSFLDLPGYGDDNQIRTALIDKFRAMADFEIVVAPTVRLVTSVAQTEYLDRSIRRLGVQNTLLVANKSDQLLNNFVKQMNQIKDAPFPDVKQCLKKTEAMLRKRIEDEGLVRGYRKHIMKIGASAYIQHEEKTIKRDLQGKGVEILLVSARQYSLCLDVFQDDEIPKLTPEATGIPRLRHDLLILPTRINYEALQYHIFETLPDVVSQIRRILQKFDEDDVYAEMRKQLAAWLPEVQDRLESAADYLPNRYVFKPWNLSEEFAIVQSLRGLVASFVHPTPYYATFIKIIKENGIPVNGKAKGRNLNEEILRTMEQPIEQWYNKLASQIESLAQNLVLPVQTVLYDLETHLEDMTDHPELRSRASDAFDTTSRRIRMAHDKLKAALETKLRNNYLLFTTEVNVKCPFALAMREVYHDVLDVQGGPGTYKRHRDYFTNRLVAPRWPKKSFPTIMATKIVNAQVEDWRKCCTAYVSEVMDLLEGFRQITDELLDSQSYINAEHRRVREQLLTMLPYFERRLDLVQKACPRLQSPDTSAKRKRDDERSFE